jgi:hypothetical protein
MAVVIGNLALLLDLASPWTVTPDRKTRTVALDVVLNLPKRSDPHAHYHASVASKSFDSDGEARSQRIVARGKSNSKVNGVDFDAGSSDEEGDQEEPFDWEKVMRKRVKEIEERRELEKKAEELQSQVEDGDEGEGNEETEEEKRMRVRKELEKVSLLILIFFFFLIFIALVICLAP